MTKWLQFSHDAVATVDTVANVVVLTCQLSVEQFRDSRIKIRPGLSYQMVQRPNYVRIANSPDHNSLVADKLGSLELNRVIQSGEELGARYSNRASRYRAVFRQMRINHPCGL